MQVQALLIKQYTDDRKDDKGMSAVEENKLSDRRTATPDCVLNCPARAFKMMLPHPARGQSRSYAFGFPSGSYETC